MACLQISRELLSLATFLRVHSNSKEVSYCHIKLKFSLWTKFLESLLLTKYLISTAATLNSTQILAQILAHNLILPYIFPTTYNTETHWPQIL